MTPQDHNKTLGIIYGVLGGLLTIGAIVELVRIIIIEKELAQIQSDSSLLTLIIVCLLLTFILLSTAYGIFKRRRWARIITLILAGLFIWLFPLGTALAIYTWWFMHSGEGKHLYSKVNRSKSAI
jgi:ABC-type transport system involved in multi-copper enzyme maturation permease subunit